MNILYSFFFVDCYLVSCCGRGQSNGLSSVDLVQAWGGDAHSILTIIVGNVHAANGGRATLVDCPSLTAILNAGQTLQVVMAGLFPVAQSDEKGVSGSRALNRVRTLLPGCRVGFLDLMPFSSDTVALDVNQKAMCDVFGAYPVMRRAHFRQVFRAFPEGQVGIVVLCGTTSRFQFQLCERDQIITFVGVVHGGWLLMKCGNRFCLVNTRCSHPSHQDHGDAGKIMNEHFQRHMVQTLALTILGPLTLDTEGAKVEDGSPEEGFKLSPTLPSSILALRSRFVEVIYFSFLLGFHCLLTSCYISPRSRYNLHVFVRNFRSWTRRRKKSLRRSLSPFSIQEAFWTPGTTISNTCRYIVIYFRHLFNGYRMRYVGVISRHT